jgi:hypothetical protein
MSDTYTRRNHERPERARRTERRLALRLPSGAIVLHPSARDSRRRLATLERRAFILMGEES